MLTYPFIVLDHEKETREIIMSNIALLLIDFQNDYFPSYDGAKWPLEGTELAAEKAASLVASFREQALPVIHVRHEFPTDEAPFFLPNSDGAKIHGSVGPIADESVILKHQINSFRDTELQQVLESLAIEKLIIVGAMSPHVH